MKAGAVEFFDGSHFRDDVLLTAIRHALEAQPHCAFASRVGEIRALRDCYVTYGPHSAAENREVHGIGRSPAC